MRIAFTIIYNGLHHLMHKGYAEMLIKHLDYWAFVDGLADNGGSTSWCKRLEGGPSTDGTIQYLEGLSKIYPEKILIATRPDKWRSKDVMVNKAIELLKEKTNSGKLWQIDADEQWTPEIMAASEAFLDENHGRTGMFYSNYYITDKYAAFGMWGEGRGFPYNRLWNWNGEYFNKHEPPVLIHGNEPSVIIPFKFEHYAYYFEKDVEFKSKYYSGHENVLDNWRLLRDGKIKTPIKLTTFMGKKRIPFPNTQIRAI